MTTPTEAVRAVSSMVNGQRDTKNFILEMRREHRTLQQGFTRLCVKWLEDLAECESHQFDLRNEASVKLAKLFVERLDSADRALPYI